MIAYSIAALFTVVAIATILTLADCWLRARSAYASLKRQKTLLDAGFVPQLEAQVVRLRTPRHRCAPAATRPFSRRVPLAAQALDAA